MNYLECYTISREMIFAIANDYPRSRRVIRRFALIMALKRKLAAHREEVRKVRAPPLPAVAAPAAAVAAPAAAVAAPVAAAPAAVPLAPLAPLAAALAAPARHAVGRRQREVGRPA